MNAVWPPRQGTARLVRRAALSALALALALAGAFAGPACGSTAQTTGGEACTYREVIPCTTDAGAPGHAECLPDLTGYGPCLAVTDGGAADAGRSDGSPPTRDGG